MTAKRPLSDSSLAGDLSDPASVSILQDPSHHLKKIKVVDAPGQDSPAMIITDPVHADLRTAINIKTALDRIDRLEQLGYCPTKVQQFRNYFDLKDRDYSKNKDDDESSASEENESPERRKIDLANQAILNKLKTVSKDMTSLSTSHACGKIPPFDLSITRPGCEYNQRIGLYNVEKLDRLLPGWFERAAISGYGDMQSLETKVDADVRNAREIPASEFQVKPELLDHIQKLWSEHFLPRKVRAEPYKIHLYGPGGHFKSHRDTPETGLVGTFLVGLGDSSSSSAGHFRIGDKTLRAEQCSWVAFHPDIPHEVTKLEDGYRAVMAFKIFRVADSEPDILPAQLEARVKKILDQIPVPFGLFTSHQYSIGTTSLNGFDALLSAYARSRNDIQAHMLPVVTEFYGEVFYSEPDRSYTLSHVYPFTRAHVDILLGKNVVQAEKEVQWLEELSDIPFYAWDIAATLEAWKEEHPDGEGYTGNEADSSREDSIYLSYAILFLPQTPNDSRDMKE